MKSMFFSLPNLQLNIHLLIQFILFLSFSHGTFHGRRSEDLLISIQRSENID